ncbi:MAG TPA: DUF480 domain-containing protein [Acidimicrobiales bacterium]
MTEMLTAEEARVVGSLAEKQLTTPQYYPLTMNALVNACNQSNNRDPVVAYDEATVEATLQSLRAKGFARVVHPGSGSRVSKYRQVLDEALGLDARELAILCVMLLRGPQTLNELRARTERMAGFDGVAAIEHDIERLTSRAPALVVRLGRQPGQREERFACTLVPAAEPGRAVAGASAAGGRASAKPGTFAARPPIPATPRLAPLREDEVTDEQRELLAASGAPSFHLFRTLAHHPGLLRRWLPFGGKLLRGGKLPERLRELVILRTAYLTGAAYEWGHHVEIGRAAGLTDDEIARVATGPDASWTGLDAAVLRACDDLHRDGAVGDDTWAVLAAELTAAQLVEVPMVSGHYRMLAGVIASLGIQPEEGQPPLPPA